MTINLTTHAKIFGDGTFQTKRGQSFSRALFADVVEGIQTLISIADDKTNPQNIAAKAALRVLAEDKTSQGVPFFQKDVGEALRLIMPTGNDVDSLQRKLNGLRIVRDVLVDNKDGSFSLDIDHLNNQVVTAAADIGITITPVSAKDVLTRKL